MSMPVRAVEVVGATRSAVRWELNECLSYHGASLFHDIWKHCKEYDTQGLSRQTQWSACTLIVAGGTWEIMLYIADRDTRWIAIYLKLHSQQPRAPFSKKSLCAHLYAELKHGDRLLARFNMKEQLFAFGLRGAQEKAWGTQRFCSMDTILNDDAIKKDDRLTVNYEISEYPDDYVPKTGVLKMRPLGLKTSWDMMAVMFDDAATADVCFVIRHFAASDDQPARIYCHMFRAGFSEGRIWQSAEQNPVQFDQHEWEEGSDSDYEDIDIDEYGQVDEYGHVDDYEEEAEGDDEGQKEERCKVEDQGEVLKEEDVLAEEEIQEEKEGQVESQGQDVSQREGEDERPLFKDEGREAHKEGGSVSLDTLRNSGNAKVATGFAHTRNRVYVTDACYRTYSTICTLAFAPLRSKYRVARNAALAESPDALFITRNQYNEENALVISPDGKRGQFPCVSAKSMYKLCDKLGTGNLKAAAAQLIHDSLTPESIFDEFHSSFSSLFPEILEDQDKYIKEHWPELCTTKQIDAFMAELFSRWPGEQGSRWREHFYSAVIKHKCDGS